MAEPAATISKCPKLHDAIKESVKKQLTDRKKADPSVSTFRKVMLSDGSVNWPALVEMFCDSDPSARKEFTVWIVESYLDQGIRLLEDLPTVKDALVMFIYLKGAKVLKTNLKVPKDESLDDRNKSPLGVNETDINSFCGLNGCTRDPPMYYLNRQRKFERPRKGLNELLALYRHQLPKKRREFLEISPDEAEIWEFDSVTVIHPKTKKAAIKFGADTKWCTARNDKDNMFDRYNIDGWLLIFIPSAPHHAGEKYQMHIPSDSFMNENDIPVGFSKLLSRFPDAWITETVTIAEGITETKTKLIGTKVEGKVDYDYTIVAVDKFAKNVPVAIGNPVNAGFIEKVFGLNIIPDKRQLVVKYSDYLNEKLINEVLVINRYLTSLRLFDLDLKTDDDEEVLELGTINAPNITSLILDDRFNRPLTGFDFLGLINLEEITFGNSFDSDISSIHAPKLRSLTFGDSFNKQFTGRLGRGTYLPDLVNITFGERFNQPIERLLAPNLTYLTFGDWFNQPIEKLQAPRLTHLTFGHDFNMPIEKLQLPNLTHLTFGDGFNQPIKNLVAPKLEKLTLGKGFDQEIRFPDPPSPPLTGGRQRWTTRRHW